MPTKLIYEDERHAQYYVEKTTGTVKALISVFEHRCLERNIQVFLLDIIHPHSVVVYIDPATPELCNELCDYMNDHHGRTDRMWTCQVIDPKGGSIMFYGTDDRKLRNLN